MRAFGNAVGKAVHSRKTRHLLELYRHDLRNARFLHRNTVESTCGLHRAFVVRNDDELRLFGHIRDLAYEPADIRLIKRRIDLVKQAERRRPVFEDRHYERDRGHRLFAARKQQDILQAFARRLCDDLDAGFENVVGLEQRHLALPAAEKLAEELLEILVDRLECLPETLTRTLFDLLQRFFRRRDALDDIVTLRRKEHLAFLGLGKFFESEHIQGTETVESFAKRIGVARARLKHEVFGDLGRGDKLGELDVQFLLAVLARILELGRGLGLSHFDLGTSVHRIGQAMIDLGKAFARAIGIGTRQCERIDRGVEFSCLGGDGFGRVCDLVRDLADRGVKVA
ncbi:MAG: hypothetical protein UZ17_ACD001000615 [Acidobacteria bacterium OLB17]|nr:MAG: hypothetical protein UZ17_ACD001000615 [Acidobacteria bacterium OLB17]